MFLLSLVASGSYYINQIYDFDSDLKNNKLGFLQKNMISKKEMMILFLITSFCSIAGGFYISNILGLIISTLVVLGYFYSAPPFRFKDRPILGLLSNSIGYGLVVPSAVLPEMNLHNVGLIAWDSPFYFICTVGAVYILTTIPDKQGDSETSKKTLAVIFPEEILKILAFILLSLSAYIAFYSNHFILTAVSMISILPLLISLFKNDTRILFFAIKFPILLLTMVSAYFFWQYGLFIVVLITATRIYYKKRFNMDYPKLT